MERGGGPRGGTEGGEEGRGRCRGEGGKLTWGQGGGRSEKAMVVERVRGRGGKGEWR